MIFIVRINIKMMKNIKNILNLKKIRYNKDEDRECAAIAPFKKGMEMWEKADPPFFC